MSANTSNKKTYRVLLILLIASFPVSGCGDSGGSGTTTNDSGTDAVQSDVFVPDDVIVQPDVLAPVCGDGVISGTEACDDGNPDSGDGCDSSCQIEQGWDCSSNPDPCTPICGDNLKKGNEECDDGNTTDGDGCQADCTLSECTEPSHCTGGNECTDRLCQEGVCSYPALADDLPCEGGDGDLCTSTCQGGICSDLVPVDCDDTDDCTIDSCNPASGACTNDPALDDTPCDGGDGDLCNSTCQSGLCSTSVPVDCNDLEDCTTDACVTATGACTNDPLPDSTPCDGGDSDRCNSTCQGGICSTSAPVNCDDTNPCTADSCYPVTGACINEGLPDGTVCPAYPQICVNEACVVSTCGDGYLDPLNSEECDSGAMNSDTEPNRCRTTCVRPTCGDGVKDGQYDEECDCGDPGDPLPAGCTDNNGGPECDVSCQTKVGCGNHILDPGEQCDDGNQQDGDGCSAYCVDEEAGSSCGNGIVERGPPEEECDCGTDPGNLPEGCTDVNGSSQCTTLCKLPSCTPGGGQCDECIQYCDTNTMTCELLASPVVCAPPADPCQMSVCVDRPSLPGYDCVTTAKDTDRDGYVDIDCSGDDCDDNNPTIHPGALEECNDVDDDCDGYTDNAPSTPTTENSMGGYGDSCVVDDDCCSHNCMSGKCGIPMGDCGGVGYVCTQNSDCCSNRCSYDFTGQTRCQPLGGCVLEGGACQVAADCCSLYCDPNTFTCSSAAECIDRDQPCTENIQCCGNLCTSLVCSSFVTCSALGETCANDNQCCSGNCVQISPVLFRCGFHNRCRATGEVCTSNDDCCTEMCDQSSGRCYEGSWSCTAEGDPCQGASGTSDCCSNLCGDPGTGASQCLPVGGCLSLGSICYVPGSAGDSTECCSGYCEDAGDPLFVYGTCKKDSNCLETGETCGSSASGQCCGGPSNCKLTMSGITRCLPSAPCVTQGGECLLDDQCCAPDLCIPNQASSTGLSCEPCQPEGGSCSIDAHCCDGTCINGTCAPPELPCKPLMAPCESSDECCSGDCMDGICWMMN